MTTITCPTCDLVSWATAEVCKRCGASIRQDERLDETSGDTRGVEREAIQTPNETYGSGPQNVWAPGTGQQPNYGNARRERVKKKQGMAVASLILGILAFPPVSMFLAGGIIFLLAVVLGKSDFVPVILALSVLAVLLPSGLIFGIGALRRVSKSPREHKGKGLAIAGIVLSLFSLIIIPFIGIIAAIAVPNLLAARRSANEGSAISTLRKLKDAEIGYMATAADGKCGDFQSLIVGRLLDPSMSKPEKSGYKFIIAITPHGDCEINAIPLIAQGVTRTGIRSFYMSSTDGWIIHAADKEGRAATKDDKPLGGDLYSRSQEPNQAPNRSSATVRDPGVDTPLNEIEAKALENLRKLVRADMPANGNRQHPGDSENKIAIRLQTMVGRGLVDEELKGRNRRRLRVFTTI